MNNQQLLDPLIHLLEIPSVSTQDKYLQNMQKARHYLTDLFSSMGFKTKNLKGVKHDAVYSQLITDKSLPTVLIYGHYDVQPPEPLNEWKSEPFKPFLKNNTIYARGATDNKGQFMVHVMAVKKLLEKNNKLPVNFKFIIEGEEEIGSISIEKLAKKYSTTLFKCNYLMVSDSEMLKKDHPAMDISLRGLVYTDVHITTTKHDLHSGQFGGVVRNPANLLSQIISKLKDEEGKVLIPGFYNDVKKPTKKELHDFKKLSITKDRIIKEAGSYGIGGGETKYSLIERMWTRPTLDVNGIGGGYQGPGSKTIIPSSASAKVSMRLVPNQEPEKIYKLFVNYIKSITPKTAKAEITNLSDALPYKAPTNHPVFSLMKQTLKKHFGNDTVFIGSGGSIGFVPIMAKALNVPCLLVGMGLPGENLHAPNEHFNLRNYFKGIDTMVDFYQKLPSI